MKISIGVSPKAGELERHAADELARYLETLFGVQAKITADPDPGAGIRFVLGLDSDPRIKQCAGPLPIL